MRHAFFSFLLVLVGAGTALGQPTSFQLTDEGHFERGGVSVLAFEDFYPQGHQSGVEIIQHGIRTATNGDLRLNPTPGQWDPVPSQDDRSVNREAGTVTATFSYPDSSKNRQGFNPIKYPDLELSYDVRVEPAGEAVRVLVDLEEPLPEEWEGEVGFNLALFPGALFGKSWSLGDDTGLFPRQPMGPVQRDADGETQATPFASGSRLIVAPESPKQRLTIESETGELKLLDARVKHNKGWFIVRSLVPSGATDGAIEWTVRPHVISDWTREPALQVSNVGYQPEQDKRAVIEMDPDDSMDEPVRLLRVDGEENTEVLSKQPEVWDGDYLRYKYHRFDFSEVTEPGTYQVAFRDQKSNPFEISEDVYDQRVWQPTLDTFLPVQMCHMRVEQQNRLWHDTCHLDDARMAHPDSNHFDGYVQGPELLTDYEPDETVPGLDKGGWHDAGDDDLRIESQAEEVRKLATMYELFDVTYDETTIRQDERVTRMHEPDGEPDILQQVEHGVLSILGGYRNLGRLYRGIIVPTVEQYKQMGDFSGQTDNLHYADSLDADERTATHSGVKDDRMVFTEQNPGREYTGIAALAIAGRVLADHNPDLARESVAAAESLWEQDRPEDEAIGQKVLAAVELLLTTENDRYRTFLLDHQQQIVENVEWAGWAVGRALPALDDDSFEQALREAVTDYASEVEEERQQNPYGVPHELDVWGAGWPVQSFGVRHYYLHRAFPEVVNAQPVFNALNFVLGVHPGQETKSYASGIGAESRTSAYGFNRDDWSYIAGGSVVGTSRVGADFAEWKEYPFIWQQNEYVMGGGSSNFMFLVLATQDLLTE